MDKEKIKTIIVKKPLKLDCGQTIKDFPIAFETYGSLNENKDNAILVCHALTGDQFVTGLNPITNKDGWRSYAVGPNKSIDTKKYFVICANVLGGCMGSYGPSHENPVTKKMFGTDFPVITINDMVNAQVNLLDHFGIKKLFSVVGGSMGGMQVLQFVSNFPNRTKTAIPIACTSSHSAQNIAFNELGRQAITADHNWLDGKYSLKNTVPDKGLAVARMAAHITYLSKKGLQEKFGRNLQERDDLKFGFDADFQIESYLRYQGSVFVDRFDANSYLYITRAMDYFDLAKQFNGNLSDAFKNTNAKFFIISFTSDWLYPTQENKDIVIALNAIGTDVGFVEIESDKGHDSFLLNVPDFLKALKNFLDKSFIEKKMKSEYKIIIDMIKENARVLDVGCDDGTLMEFLKENKKVDIRGIEISKEKVQVCIAKGLTVIEGNAEFDLKQFPNNSFDYVVLGQTLQAFINPETVIRELLRVGKKAIVTIPNFGHWKVRLNLLTRGTMPVTKTLPNNWYNTPNIHMCTIKDFVKFSEIINFKIFKSLALINKKVSNINNSNLFLKNLFAELGIFLIEK